MVVLASALTITVAPPSAEAASAGSSWYVGPNSPDVVANQTTYYGMPFTPRFYGLQIPVVSVGAGGFSHDGVDHPGLWTPVAGPSSAPTYSVDIPGATVTPGFIQGFGNGITISCAIDTCATGLSSFQITRTYSGTYQSNACVDAYWDDPVGSLSDACPGQLLEATQTRTVIAGPEPTDQNFQPTASFIATQAPADRFEWSFSSRASDDRDETAELTHAWDFGDGATSDEMNPTHRYDTAGEHEVTLTVTDRGGLSASSSQDITISSGLVVNSTGDGSALDAAERGCDTGGSVGDEPECTLRAAIEAAEAMGGGDISFAIEGGGLPTIAAAGPLPAMTTSVTIDGTSQDGGLVGLSGGGATLLTLAGGTSRVTGLVIDQATDAVTVTGGIGHVIEANRFGTDAAGTIEGALDFGVIAAGSSGLIVRDNQFVVDEGGVAVGPEATGVEFVGNSVGVDATGTASLGDPASAVLIAGPDAQVRDNHLWGRAAGVEVVGATASGARIEGNTVGLDRAATATLDGMGYGIRVDGAPGATITANTVWSPGWGAILVSGTVQVESGDDESTYTLVSPGAAIEDQPITGGSATIAGNTIGLASGDQAAEPAIQRGVYSWSGADDVVVSANTVAGATVAAIELETGARHTITGNRIGTDASGSAAVPARVGVSVFGASEVTIGGTGGDGNTILAEIEGVELGDSTTVEVTGNSVTGADESGGFTGVDVDTATTGVTLDANVLSNGSIGIRNESTGATITGNTVSDFADIGIRSRGDDTSVTGNVSSTNGVGIAVSGQDLTVSQNQVGLDGATGTVVGNADKGIDIGEGSTAALTRNVVAGSGAQGIHVTGGSTATLRANRILSSGGQAIDAVGAPAAPTLAAAVRSISGTSSRTTLLLTDLPLGDAGTLEVFANDSCSDPEAEVVMDIVRTKKASEQVRIIQITGNGTRDNFTVTYTDEDGRTSELSTCAPATVHGDADGDGSQDPFDEIFGLEDDATRAVIPTDSEELLWIAMLGDGELSALAVVDDPAPGSHPEGWSLSYGTISFRIVGLEPGAATAVSMTTITGDSPVAGTSYWKYGAPTPGSEARWYQFGYDAATGTGARLSDAQDIPGLGIRRSFLLELRDGARGDDDGGANGTITDPGGPVVGGDIDIAAPIDPPPEPPTDPPTDPPVAPTPTTEAVTVEASTSGTVPLAATAHPVDPSGALPFTGGSPMRLVLVAVTLLLAGALFAGSRRRFAGPRR